MHHETILNVFPASDDQHRLVIAIEQRTDGDRVLVLRQETYSPDVGWFVQSCVAIEPEQLPGLKMALTSGVTRKLQSPAREVSRAAVLSFSESVAGRVG